MNDMQIQISPERYVGDIQREFNDEFPYLKLEFYQNKVFQQPDFGVAKMLSPHQKLEKAQTANLTGRIEILPEMKVSELEKKFKDQFSLVAQVFRRSGNSWLQTTMTDNWTLMHQNTHGQEISDGGKLKN
jgi:hypothetical protein